MRRRLTSLALAALAVALAAPAAHGEMVPVGLLGTGGYGTGDGGVNAPLGVAVGPNGKVFVADSRNDRIQRFSADGVFEVAFGAGGDLTWPNAVAVGPDGTVVVADTSNNRIVRYTSAGVRLGAFGSMGSANGRLFAPMGVAVDADGTILVSDTFNNRVQRFSATGAYQAKFGSNGRTAGRFQEPAGVAVAADGDVWVADRRNNRLQRFSSAGTFELQVPLHNDNPPQSFYPDGPWAVALDRDGSLYVTEPALDRVLHLAPDGTVLGSWGEEGTALGQLGDPSGVAVGPDGSVYVTESENFRVQRFADVGASLVPGTDMVTLTNTGRTDLPITQIALDSPDVEVAGETCPDRLRSADSCTIQLRPRSGARGTAHATLTVTAAIGTWTGHFTAPVTATAASPPRLRLTPTAVRFPSVAVGTTGAPQSLTLRNVGSTATDALHVVVAGREAAAFVLTADGCGGRGLAVGASCTVQIAHRPTRPAVQTAIVEVRDAGNVLRARISVVGRGDPA